MIKLEHIIGDIIFISFKSIECFKEIGINTTSGHFLFKGYDQMGLWLEHPGLVMIHNEDDSGNPLPVSEQLKENIAANFIVTWENINTIMHYPDRKGYDFPSEFKKNIGFNIKNKFQK